MTNRRRVWRAGLSFRRSANEFRFDASISSGLLVLSINVYTLSHVGLGKFDGPIPGLSIETITEMGAILAFCR